MNAERKRIRLFLSGDVMTGRGIDQILPHPGEARLHEAFVKDARYYVHLAERHSGPIPRGVDCEYIWGDALAELDNLAPDLRIVNLETAVTTSDDHWRVKAVHYRMNPANVDCLTAARLDCCVVANNHVLDWGYAGLEETLTTLRQAGIAAAGAGRTLAEAQRPAILRPSTEGRVLVFAAGSPTRGVPRSWAAEADRPGVHVFDETAPGVAEHFRTLIETFRRPDDLVIVSLHWGPNWGYDVPEEQRRLAHELIDHCGVALVHGHSSHHVKGFEVYRRRLILYGCGDLLTDYEGIGGHEEYRGDLGLMYFPTLDADTGELVELTMRPTQMQRLRLRFASTTDGEWLAAVLNREMIGAAGRVVVQADGRLAFTWE